MDDLYDLCMLKPPTKASATKCTSNFLKLMKNSTKSQLQDLDLEKSLFCAIKVLSFCDEALHTSNSCIFKVTNYYETVKDFYCELLQAFSSRSADSDVDNDEIIKSVIEITHNQRLWKWEDLCHDLIHGIVDSGVNEYKVISCLLEKAQNEETASKDSQKILRILYKSLEDYFCSDEGDTCATVDTFLTLYHETLTSPVNEKQVILKKSLEVCIMNIIKHLSTGPLLSIISRMGQWTLEETSHDDEIILEFSNLLESAGQHYKMKFLENILNQNLFFLLLKMISSSNASVSLVGNRILQHLIDRNGNKSQFQAVKIFFENTDHDIKINDNNSRDEEFLKKYRELIHDSFLQGVMNHCSLRINLEAMYCTICLIAVEVPCGFTAAALACLVMNIQDLTLEHLDANRPVTYHVHAAVLGIMSLICWIHKAKVFYSYVNTVLMERAQWAPHLNPPLATHYDFAMHHVLWDKPELFFIDWEVRFGLWKCFRPQSDEEQDQRASEIKN